MHTCLLHTNKMAINQQLIFCTFPDKSSAESIARLLINEKLAACVNIISGVTSIYAWEQKIETAEECLLLIKANKSNYQLIEEIIKKRHPYELPEIIAVSIEDGLPEYLHWIDSCHFLK